ncbi:hypothetical protein WME89_51880 [Sorangium sp. So ce321]|uniref:hypothetical protein n=1 Tax=Sorangium sp. So ce321 TaxID=3133300 RepID=UPI003F62C367
MPFPAFARDNNGSGRQVQLEGPAAVVLGKITVAWRGGRALVDTGEWKSGFGVSKERDGTEKLVLIDSPYVGWAFLLAEQGDQRTLTLESAQQKHVFVETDPAAGGAGQRRHQRTLRAVHHVRRASAVKVPGTPDIMDE